jgi:hypothetical protein
MEEGTSHFGLCNLQELLPEFGIKANVGWLWLDGILLILRISATAALRLIWGIGSTLTVCCAGTQTLTRTCVVEVNNGRL